MDNPARPACSVSGCSNTKNGEPDLTFFRIPKNPARAKIWLQQIGVPADINKTVFVCEEHFESHFFYSITPPNKLLVSVAVPRLKIPPKTESSMPNNFTATKEPQEDDPKSTKLQPQKLQQQLKTETEQILEATVNDETFSSQTGPKEEFSSQKATNSYRDNIVFIDDDDDLSTEDPDGLLDIEPSIVGKRKSNENETPHRLKRNKIQSNAETKIPNTDAVLTVIPTATRTTKTTKLIVSANELRVQNENQNPKTASLKSSYVYAVDGKLSKTNKIAVPATKETDTDEFADINVPYTLKLNSKLQQTPEGAGFHSYKGVCSATEKIHEIQLRIRSLSLFRKGYCQLSLKLYFRFPKEYKLLQNLLLLPSVSELKEVFNDSAISLEKDVTFAKYLLAKTKLMTFKQKQCFVCVGEIDIKPRLLYCIKNDTFIGIHDFDDILKPKPATKAVVLIVQGIYFEWKQLVAMGYLEDKPQINMKNWIEKNIKSLLDLGLNVRAVVKDNISMKGSNQCQQNSHYISGNTYYCINDISSMFKSFYYNFFKYDYMYNGCVAKSKYIEQYYELDRNRNVPLSPKLTKNHMNPLDLQKLTLEHVLDVFDMTTAAAISTYIDFKIIEEYAKPTVNIIARMRFFYDLLNTGRFDNGSKIQNGFSGHVSQRVFLKDMLSLFDSLKLIDKSTNNVIPKECNVTSSGLYEWIDMFKVLINAVLSLYDDLKRECLLHLPIWRFNTDAVEHFFDKVHKHSKSITKPTAKAVDSVFRQMAVLDILKSSFENFTPKTPNLYAVLQEFHDIIKLFRVINDKREDQWVIDYENVSQIAVESCDYNLLDMNRKDGLIFLAGYLLKKCLDVHDKCIVFKRHVNNLDDETRNMSESIKEDIENGTCIAPTRKFIEFVEAMEILFRTFINRDILITTHKKIAFNLIRSMRSLNISSPCQCVPLTYIKKLYVRFRIYHTLKYNNLRIKSICKSGIIVNKL